MKFMTPHRIGLVRGDQPRTRSFYVHSVRRHVFKKETLFIQTEGDPRKERSHPQPVEGFKKVEVDGLEKMVQI